MRTVILLLFMAFSMAIFAKNKAHSLPLHLTSGSLKTIENSALYKSSGADIEAQNSVFKMPWYIGTASRDFSNFQHFYFSDPFFNNEEFSYKNNHTSGGSSATFFENNSIPKRKIATEVSTIFQQGLFYGFVATLVLLTIVCFFLFDEKTFLLYSLVISSTSLLLFLNDGLLSLLGWDMVDAFNTFQSLFVFIVALFSAFFAERYLNLKEFIPKFKWVSSSLLVIAAVGVLISVISKNEIFTVVANITSFTTLFAYFMAGVYLFSKKNYAKFYVIASFVPLLFCLDFFVFQPIGIEFLATQAFHIKAAMISEMLILTYANMFRMQAIKEENALRQVEMRIFLKRQEALTSRQKTEKLVEDVYLENLIMHYDLDGLEIKLLQYISEGKDNAKIARKLNTTEIEIEEMTKELYEKLEIGEQIQQDYRMVEQQPDYIYN